MCFKFAYFHSFGNLYYGILFTLFASFDFFSEYVTQKQSHTYIFKFFFIFLNLINKLSKYKSEMNSIIKEQNLNFRSTQSEFESI